MPFHIIEQVYKVYMKLYLLQQSHSLGKSLLRPIKTAKGRATEVPSLEN